MYAERGQVNVAPDPAAIGFAVFFCEGVLPIGLPYLDRVSRCSVVVFVAVRDHICCVGDRADIIVPPATVSAYFQVRKTRRRASKAFRHLGRGYFFVILIGCAMVLLVSFVSTMTSARSALATR